MTRSDHFRHWLTRPVAVPGKPDQPRYTLLSVARWCLAVGYGPPHFSRFLHKNHPIAPAHLSNLITIAEGFGYMPMNSEHHIL